MVLLMVRTVVVREGKVEGVDTLVCITGGSVMTLVVPPIVVIMGGGRMLVSNAKVEVKTPRPRWWFEKLIMFVVIVAG